MDFEWRVAASEDYSCRQPMILHGAAAARRRRRTSRNGSAALIVSCGAADLAARRVVVLGCNQCWLPAFDGGLSGPSLRAQKGADMAYEAPEVKVLGSVVDSTLQLAIGSLDVDAN